MTKPTIILVPGGWHTPECFSLITSGLESHGYTVRGIQLPGVGGTDDLGPNITALRDLVTEEIDDGNDVVVVPHSWGGIVTGSALTGLGKKQREENSEKGGVVRLAYMCAFIIDEGVSLMDAVGGKVLDWWKIEGPSTNVKDPSIFYNDLPAADIESWGSKLLSHSFATFQDPARAANWKEIPTSYLLCEDDLAIPAWAQEAMTDKVKEMGGHIEVQRVKTSHSPFLSMPNVVVDWIRKAAGEEGV